MALLRIKNIPLLELHVGVNNNHTNPDGERVSGTHWHIYSEKYGRAQAYAAPDIAEENFVENTILFLDRFHVINKPEVGLQQELF